jgi:hypothetical protein
MHKFPNAFAWEYPSSPDPSRTAGILSSGPHATFAALDAVQGVAQALSLPRGEWECNAYHYPTGEPQCTNPFFHAWRRNIIFDYRESIACLSFVMYVSAMVVAVLTLANEWMIANRPYWMRCRCLFFKRYCPCPKGTKEEIETMDENSWDKLRLWYCSMTVLYFLMPACFDTLMPMFFISHLEFLERDFPPEMTMAGIQGTGYRVLSWASAGSAVFALFCLRLKWQLTGRPKGWMEQQTLENVPAEFLAEGSSAQRAGEATLEEDVDLTLPSRNYTNVQTREQRA